MNQTIKLYKEVICPHLNSEELCSIYERRFNCCRNFPNRTSGMFCSTTTKCVYTYQGELDCFNCKDKCCKHILVEIDKQFNSAILDIDCITCTEKYG